MSIFFAVHHSPAAFLQATRPYLSAHQRKLNVILPHAEKLEAYQKAGHRLAPGQFWITAWSPPSSTTSNKPGLEFIISCTEHHLGTYPLFLVFLRPLPSLPPSTLDLQMTLLAEQLTMLLEPSRVFSIYGQEAPVRALATRWSALTGAKQVLEPYYEASSSYCTKETLVVKTKASMLPAGHEMRMARAEDVHAVAQLCQEFAADSVCMHALLSLIPLTDTRTFL